MRLVNADTVVTIQVYDDMTEETDTKKMTIAEAIDEWSDEGCPPTVDAIEVVRCKDCKKYIPCQKLPIGTSKWCDMFDRATCEMNYCGWGERREDETG